MFTFSAWPYNPSASLVLTSWLKLNLPEMENVKRGESLLSEFYRKAEAVHSGKEWLQRPSKV